VGVAGCGDGREALPQPALPTLPQETELPLVPSDIEAATSPLAGMHSCEPDDSPVAALIGSDSEESESGASDIWTMTVDGELVPLTSDGHSLDPWMSHDGERLYFTRSAGGTEGDAPALGRGLWVLDLDSGTESLLYEAAEGSAVNRPEASADGNAVVFDMLGGDAERQRVYVLDVTSGEATELPMPPDDGSFQGQQGPTWGPDGAAVAYLHTRADPETAAIVWTVRVVELSTFAEKIVHETRDPIGLVGLEWSPDGRALLVTEIGQTPGEPDMGATAVSIDIASADPTVLAEQVPFDVTYAGADGQTVAAVGPLREDTQDPSSAQQPWLTIWDNGEMVLADAPVALTSAHSLTIADCAFD